MQLEDLQPDERLALVALSRAIVRADGAVSAKEGERVAELGQALGEQRYREAFREAAQRFADEAALKAFLETIERPDARELIYETILDLAVADAVSPDEVTLLRWLDAAWKLTPALE
jgi:uncharacterized tellurite resistance protein B-like protein